jgi:hypothetical protein
MAIAQDASPATDPPPVTTPAPPSDSSPVTSEETTAPATATAVAKATPRKAATVRAATTRRTVTTNTHIVTHKAPAPAATASAPAATTAPAPTAPIAEPVAQPAPVPPVQSAKPVNNDLPLELGAGALALLALGGAAVAVSRRRRSVEEEEVWADEPSEPVAETEPEPMTLSQPVAAEAPAMVAPPMSAFAWGNEPRKDLSADDRRPGESWVERAYRGPSANNPSVSLKNRLRRAAFFDKREREVAAGTAEPVEADAGLPEAMVEEQANDSELA